MNQKDPDKPNRPIKFYARSREGKAPSEWQPLEVHLKKVSEMARGFAEGLAAGGKIQVLEIKQKRR